MMRPLIDPASWGALHDEMITWRRDIHAHPEIAFEVHRTADFVARTLAGLGLAVERGLAGTGVVGTLEGRGPGDAIALRADMDALPIEEKTGAPHRSTVPGRMHACGHDGHVAMLLGPPPRPGSTGTATTSTTRSSRAGPPSGCGPPSALCPKTRSARAL